MTRGLSEVGSNEWYGELFNMLTNDGYPAEFCVAKNPINNELGLYVQTRTTGPGSYSTLGRYEMLLTDNSQGL
jgi:hypothetical protein